MGDQCEALREFLCTVDMSLMSYDRLLDLEEQLGSVTPSSSFCVTDEAVASLPSRQKGITDALGQGQEFCVICQDPLDEAEVDAAAGDELADIRTLPCGHEYHFKCIARWLQMSNTCCVCQSAV